MNDIQKYLLECAIQTMNESVGGLIANGGIVNGCEIFASYLDPIIVVRSLEELKQVINETLRSHSTKVETNITFLTGSVIN
jgi:hypothetical protein